MLGTHWLVAKQLSVAVDVGAQIHHTAKVSYAFTITIGVRAGGGGRGGLQPPQILGNKRKFGQSQVLKTFRCFFYCYFEEINILFFILTKILTSVGVVIKLHSLET